MYINRIYVVMANSSYYELYVCLMGGHEDEIHRDGRHLLSKQQNQDGSVLSYVSCHCSVAIEITAL